MANMKVNTNFTAKDGVSKAVKKATKSVKIFGKTSTAAFNRASRSGSRFGSALKGAFAFISARQVLRWSDQSIKAFQEQETAIANVKAGLVSTNMVAGRSLKQLTTQAQNFQKNTFFGDEAILQGVTAQMLTFTNITGKQFDRAQAAVLDVTAKLKGLDAGESDLRATTIMLSKALNDPVANLGALGRAGIQFSKEQKVLIKQLSNTGRVAEAQEMILKELENQYGGTAAAIAKSSGGIEKSLKNKIGDAMEEVGKQLLPVKLQLLQLLNVIVPFIPTLLKLAPLILTLVAAWKAYQVAVMIATAFQNGFNIALMANPIGLIVAGIVVLIGIIVLLVKNWDKVKAALVKGATFIKNIFIAAWEGIKRGFIAAFGVIKKVFFTIVDYFLTIYGTVVKGILGAAIKVGKALGKDVSGLQSIVQKVSDVQAKVSQQSYIGGVTGKINSATTDFTKQAPNAKQAQASSYSGQLNINAPAGSTYSEKKTGVQPINVNMVGAN